MADVINLQAEDNRNIIDDDAVPTLTLTNTHASGFGAKVENTNATGGTALDVNSTAGVGIDVDVSGSNEAINADSASGKAIVAEGLLASTIQSSATAASALEVAHKSTIVSSVTVAPFRVISSAASGPLVDFGVIDSGGVVSAATGAPTVVAAIRVKIGDSYGWLRAYTD